MEFRVINDKKEVEHQFVYKQEKKVGATNYRVEGWIGGSRDISVIILISETDTGLGIFEQIALSDSIPKSIINLHTKVTQICNAAFKRATTPLKVVKKHNY